jgi:hypothetical protein
MPPGTACATACAVLPLECRSRLRPCPPDRTPPGPGKAGVPSRATMRVLTPESR